MGFTVLFAPSERYVKRFVIRGFLALASFVWVVFEAYISVRNDMHTLPQIGIFRGDGNSMEPIISPPGFLVYTSFSTYDVGDVIIFKSGTDYVIHRIIKETSEGYLTKGDGNQYDDQEYIGMITEKEVLGGVCFAISEKGFGNPCIRLDASD